MDKTEITLLMSPKEISKILSKRIREFYKKDCTKKLFKDFIDSISEEAKKELLKAGKPLREENEIKNMKETFLELNYLQSEQISVKNAAKLIDTILASNNGDTDEIKQKQINSILKEELLLKEVKSVLQDKHYRYLAKKVLKLGMIEKKN